MKLYILALASIFGPAFAMAGEPDCDTSPINEVVPYYFSDEFSALDNHLLEIHYENFSTKDNYIDLVVVSEEVLRGGSTSLVTIDVFKGKETGVCSLPVSIDLKLQVSDPYNIDIIASDYYPDLDINYTFFADNSFGNFDTTSLFVSDLREELYGYHDGNYALKKKTILNCIVCAPEKKQ